LINEQINTHRTIFNRNLPYEVQNQWLFLAMHINILHSLMQIYQIWYDN